MLSILCNSHIKLKKNGRHPERITKVNKNKNYMDGYNWEGKND